MITLLSRVSGVLLFDFEILHGVHMPLIKHLAQGRLLYFTRYQDAISVLENEHYRWMVFDDVIQSLMLKRKPEKLTLPHQTILLLPLLFFSPKNIVEFGLGGGNCFRFIHQLSNEIEHTIVEYDNDVIQSFNAFFNPNKAQVNLIAQTAQTWSDDQLGTTNKDGQTLQTVDWYIYDIYEVPKFSNSVKNIVPKAFQTLLINLNNTQFLSLNVPFATPIELKQLLSFIKVHAKYHDVVLFKIPDFQNNVIHIIPKSRNSKSEHARQKSLLKAHTISRWFKIWQYGKWI